MQAAISRHRGTLIHVRAVSFTLSISHTHSLSLTHNTHTHTHTNTHTLVYTLAWMQAAISRHRGKLGAPTMMEILTNPGWDEKVPFPRTP